MPRVRHIVFLLCFQVTRWVGGIVAMFGVGSQIVLSVNALTAIGYGHMTWMALLLGGCFFLLGVRLGQGGWRSIVRMLMVYAEEPNIRGFAEFSKTIQVLWREGNPIIVAPVPVLCVAGLLILYMLYAPAGSVLTLVITLGSFNFVFGYFFSWFFYGDWINQFTRQVRRLSVA